MITANQITWHTSAPISAAPNVATLLAALHVWLGRYVVLTDAQAVAVVLWAAHTHTIQAAECTPYLQVTSAMKGSGKTRLLEVLEPVVARPWLTGRTSAAALVRKVHAERPTLLLDESDAAFGGDKDYAEALRGILNSGYRSSGKATLCVGQGANLKTLDFHTFCAKAIAGIGELPGTIADRAIRIELRRRTAAESCERWRQRDGHEQAAPFHDELAQWAAAALEALRQARPTVPNSLSDRKADCWEPLFAIADLAGGTWPSRARHAAVELAGSVGESETLVELLTDISEILTGFSGSVIPTKELLEKLTAQDDRPWATWSHGGKPLTPHRLTRLLGPLGIHPDRHLRTVRGYRLDALTDAIVRYVPIKASQCHKPNRNGPELANSECRMSPVGDASETSQSSMTTGLCDTVTLQNGGDGGGGDNGGLF
jgi:hypothetical protein